MFVAPRGVRGLHIKSSAAPTIRFGACFVAAIQPFARIPALGRIVSRAVV